MAEVEFNRLNVGKTYMFKFLATSNGSQFAVRSSTPSYGDIRSFWEDINGDSTNETTVFGKVVYLNRNELGGVVPGFVVVETTDAGKNEVSIIGSEPLKRKYIGIYFPFVLGIKEVAVIGGLKSKKTTKKNTKIIINKNNKTKKQREKECVKKLIGKKLKELNDGFDKDIKKFENNNKNNMNSENKKRLAEFKKNKKVFGKIMAKTYKSLSCNIGCAGTYLEPGDSSKLPAKYAKQLKDYPKKTIKLFEEERKRIFGDKTTVLDEDSFYEKLNKKLKDDYIKSGAVSHCSMFK
jgi:hypothetical protein